MMITPPYIKEKSKIGIVSTARKISMAEIEYAVKFLEEKGFEVVVSKYLFQIDNQFAGTDNIRALALQEMLDDNSIEAIICARGGYGTVKIIDKIDFTKFIANPKWIVGYSDVCVLHSHINANFNIKTLHASMLINFARKNETENIAQSMLVDFLKGDIKSYILEKSEYNKQGKAKGEIVGGNLSILYSLLGSKSDIDTNNKVLFLEDLDEYLYHIDRMMMALKRAGKFDNIKSLVIGGMSDMNDNTIPYGKTPEQIITEALHDFSFPICFNFPAGHIDNNFPIVLGGEATIDVGEKNSTVEFE